MRITWIVLLATLVWQNAQSAKTVGGFSCEGRASGYYADVEAGCQVYHMCDGLGRQFSYSCPNTTLFQQRMLICDHWYMVNCSKSELDYGANLLIGQRDKPFVDDSSENPYHRTPRPDLETNPYAPRFQSDYRQAKAQFGTNQNLVGAERENENGTTDGPQYFLPSHWSTWYSKGSTTPLPFLNKKYSKNPVIEKPTATLFRNEPKIVKTSKNVPKNIEKKDIVPPSRYTLPPFAPRDTFPTTENINTVRQKLTRTTNEQSTTYQGLVTSTTLRIIIPKESTIGENTGFPSLSKILQPPKINTRNPIEPNSQFPGTETNKFSISSLNPSQHATIVQSTQPFKATEAPITDSQISNSFKNPRPSEADSFSIITSTEPPFNSPSSYLNPSEIKSFPNPSSLPLVTNEIEPPSMYYQPPKLTFFLETDSSTMDPITFYNLVPSKDLLPPKIISRSDDEKVSIETTTTTKSITKKDTNNYSTRAPPVIGVKGGNDSEKKWKELRHMFFIPEYDFPLDLESRPGYDSGVSSFHAKQAPPNPEIRPQNQTQGLICDPKCDPSFLMPGTCKPCVMIRR